MIRATAGDSCDVMVNCASVTLSADCTRSSAFACRSAFATSSQSAQPGTVNDMSINGFFARASSTVASVNSRIGSSADFFEPLFFFAQVACGSAARSNAAIRRRMSRR